MEKRKLGRKPKWEHMYPRIIELLNTGMPYEEIATQIGCSDTTVFRVARKALMEEQNG